METTHSISSLLNSTIRNLKRSHDQMSNGALNQPTSSNRPFSSVFDSFPNFSMPNLPTFRFAGDGLDYRRPAPTVPLPNNQDIIDLTEDLSPEVQRQTRPSNRTNPGNFIDIDEESITVNVDDARQSPDLELLEVRSIRSQNTSVPDHRPRENVRPRSTLRPPHTENQPFAVGGWNGLRQHAQGHRSSHNHETARRFHHLLHTNHPNPRREMLLMHQSPEIILPGDLDFVTQGFQMGDATNRQQPPRLPTYEAPLPAMQGFTRSPKEDDHLVCPNCEEELGAGKDDSKRQVWVIKACGHVYCGECTHNRSPLKKGRGARNAPTKPFSRCVVEGCTSKKPIAGPRSFFQVYL